MITTGCEQLHWTHGTWPLVWKKHTHAHTWHLLHSLVSLRPGHHTSGPRDLLWSDTMATKQSNADQMLLQCTHISPGVVHISRQFDCSLVLHPTWNEDCAVKCKPGSHQQIKGRFTLFYSECKTLFGASLSENARVQITGIVPWLSRC